MSAPLISGEPAGEGRFSGNPGLIRRELVSVLTECQKLWAVPAGTPAGHGARARGATARGARRARCQRRTTRGPLAEGSSHDRTHRARKALHRRRVDRPGSAATPSRSSPPHRAGHRPRPARLRGGCRPGGGRRAQRLRRRPLAAHDASTSGSRSSAGSRTPIAVRHEEIARSISSQNGSPYSWSVLAQALGAMMVWDAAITVARDFPYEERRDGVLGPILVRREPVGRRRGRRAVERPAVHRRRQARPRRCWPAAP